MSKDIIKWPLVLAFVLALTSGGLWYWGHVTRELTGSELIVDRIDTNWQFANQMAKFDLVIRNNSDFSIGNYVTFEVILDLSKVSVRELERTLPEDREGLLKGIDVAFSEGSESEYLRAIYEYLKGNLHSKVYDGYIFIEIPKGEASEYKLMIESKLSLRPHETTAISLVGAIPSHYTPRKTTIRAVGYRKW
jgi:hypothetical protein